MKTHGKIWWSNQSQHIREWTLLDSPLKKYIKTQMLGWFSMYCKNIVNTLVKGTEKKTSFLTKQGFLVLGQPPPSPDLDPFLFQKVEKCQRGREFEIKHSTITKSTSDWNTEEALSKRPTALLREVVHGRWSINIVKIDKTENNQIHFSNLLVTPRT